MQSRYPLNGVSSRTKFSPNYIIKLFPMFVQVNDMLNFACLVNKSSTSKFIC